MKSMVTIVGAVAVLFTSMASIAQSSDSDHARTRADIKADLARFERAGFNPAVAVDPYYPADMQAAQARIAIDGGTANPVRSGELLSGTATNVDYVPVQ
ncbi:protein of unknown function [Paraburkholderia fungorum]|uniref:DUF4148 domain-containing protein n=1 Tax=Paraburkholderia fungorum TaxID=134537 RepID=A0A1H1K068_9BURK|nr:DUF4148 domain-containing protein [Paraburkholderia fungorum]SDR55430.1 protein of unknown function [Paraburkholderia fungorum]